MKDHWNVLYQVSAFYADRIPKMATTAGHRLTLDPRRSLKCEEFTDDGRQVMAIVHFGPGELKSLNVGNWKFTDKDNYCG
jgi:hypothetical protein